MDYKLSFFESNNLQSTADVIQPEQGYLPNIVASNFDFSMNDNDTFPTSHNYSVHQSTFNENIPISRSYPPIDLQQSTADIQPEREHSSNINYNVVNVDLNDNSIPPTFHTNNNHFNQQHTSNVQSYPPPITSSYAQQYSMVTRHRRNLLKILLLHLIRQLLTLLNLKYLVLIFPDL